MNEQVEFINGLARHIYGTLPALADPTRGFALLDFPDYANVGDSLIWLGELAYFDRQVGKRAGYVSTRDGFDPDKLRRAVPEGPIYLSGGGNFGDLWPRFQEFRLRVLQAFPDRIVVQLPQTIHFADPANAAPTRSAIAAHGKFKMLVRDRNSLAFAQEQLDCPVQLCPDMAFCIGPLQRTAPPSHDLLLLLRTDQEKLAARGERLDTGRLSAITADWIQPPQRSRAQKLVQAALKRLPSSEEARFRAQAEAQMRRGISILQQGRGVVTDRLHGHILSLLLGLPQVVIDNSYGKVRSFAELWTAAHPAIHLADDLADAGRLLERLLEPA